MNSTAWDVQESKHLAHGLAKGFLMLGNRVDECEFWDGNEVMVL